MPTLRLIVYVLAGALTAGAALAASDPPAPDQLASSLDRLADMLEQGGPAVYALLGVLALAFLATLGAFVIVIMAGLQHLPRVARPLADAVATIRGGPTQREEALRRENTALRAEVETLTGKVSVLEHSEEESRRIVGVLLDRLEAANIDVAAVRAIYRAEPDAVPA
ncbi:hypothetical protein [Azospirillum argentinense]|uniref:Uncharacterized protein n=1 Tax=Azospirillum brasilense TaxID=192 RepID=A0A4D8QAH9_AZOBR|nr:hypothetical protein [Azospirillum argentinense]QCO07375.1 hypothetical protein D3867_36495 [Azospirillum argentinense]